MSDKQQKHKPEKDSFIKYYVINPIVNTGEVFVTFIEWCWLKATGAWWCHHCSKWHGRRVRKYLYHDIICDCHIDRNICSLGRDATLNGDVQPNTDKRGDLKIIEDEITNAAEQLVRDAYEQLYKEGVYKDLAN
jgi:hypothetical protein